MPMQTNQVENRIFTFDIEHREEETPKLFGHAAIFNTYADLGCWEERIMPGAFNDSIGTDDIRALFNHDSAYVLARNKSGTLKLWEDERGLAFEIVPPDTQLIKDLVLAPIKRGDINQMSFGFQVLKETWTESQDMKQKDKRDILNVKLWEISPVTFPAYVQTDVSMRSYEAWKQSLKPVNKIESYRRKLNIKAKEVNYYA